MTQPLGIGLVGYGAIGRLHALCYRMLPLVYPALPPVQLVAVATASSASAERARAELGDLMATTSLETLLSHPELTVVDCCAPTGDHAQIAQATLAAGKALFWEKPLAASLEEATAIVETARRQNTPGGVNFHFRQVPALQEARRLIEAGLLGEVISFHLRYYRASNLRRDRALTWRFSGPGSGVLADLGSHMIDMVLHLLGPLSRVAAQTRTLIPERPDANGRMAPVESDDVAWLQLQLHNGGRGTVEVSKLVPGAGDDIRIEAYGTHGALSFDTRDPNGLAVVEDPGQGVGDRRIAMQSRMSPAASLPSAETPTSVIAWHLASIAGFLSTLSGTPAPYADLKAGLEVDRVIDAARRSAQQNGVSIPL